MTSDAAGARPAVGIWRSSWLPASETFIINQAAALRRWHPYRIGLRTLPDGLPVTPDLAPFGSDPIGRVRHRVSRATGYRFPYDRWLSRHRISVLHAHFGPGGVKLLPIARRSGIPLLVTFHGFDATTAAFAETAAGEKYRAQLATLFEGAAALVAVSAFIRGRLIALGAPAERIRVLPIGIPVPAEPVPLRPARTDSHQIVTFVGRLVELKSADHLLSAVAELPAALRERTTVRIIGAGPQDAALRELAGRLDVHAEFLGRRTPAEVAEALATTTVFSVPSRTIGHAAEGFGIVHLEAAAAGLPSVAYRSGGVPEAVVDGVTGLLAPEGDIEALSTALEQLLGDPARAAELGEAGRRRVFDSFDIVRRTAELEKLYDEVAGN